MSSSEVQRAAALRRSAEVRSARSAALFAMRRHEITPDEALDHPDLQSVTAARFVAFMPMTHHPRPKGYPSKTRKDYAIRFCIRRRISLTKRIEDLTDNQRRMILSAAKKGGLLT